MIFYDEPKNDLPRADLAVSTYRMDPRTPEDMLDKYSYLPTLWKKAIKQPGQEVSIYFNENGYEYEWWVVYNPEDNTFQSTGWCCPCRASHHIGSLCGCCGNDERHIYSY